MCMFSPKRPKEGHKRGSIYAYLFILIGGEHLRLVGLDLIKNCPLQKSGAVRLQRHELRQRSIDWLRREKGKLLWSQRRGRF
jgi:hypothetical protein